MSGQADNRGSGLSSSQVDGGAGLVGLGGNAPDVRGAGHLDLLPCLHEASNPFWDWLWGGAEQGRAQLVEWMMRANSELSATRLVCLRHEDRVVGGYIACAGSELQVCRKADLVAVMDHLRRDPTSPLLDRMRQARSLFSAAGDDEFYLSRVGVMPSGRGRGFGRKLATMFIEDGKAKGFRRFRLDVSMDNAPAISLYRKLGFTLAGESSIPGTNIRYQAMSAEFRST